MIEDIESQLLGDDAVNIGILLVFSVTGVGALMYLVGQLQEDPHILLALLLHETAIVHENNQLSGILLPLLFGEQASIELIYAFGHAHCVAFLLYWGLRRNVRHYFCLLDIGLYGFLLRRLQGRVVNQSLQDCE